MASNILIKNLPEDVYDDLVREQARIRLEKKVKVNLGIVIIKCLREYFKSKKQQ